MGHEMAGQLDQISAAIGELRADVRNGNDKLDHLHKCLHDNGGIVDRLNGLERDKARGAGVLIGIGAASGAAGGALLRTLAMKLGLG